MKAKRTWGFRFSSADGMALFVFMLIGGVFLNAGSSLGWLLLITAGHFFLFCNVFRIIRHLELIWAAIFIVNVMLWTESDRLSWSLVLLTQLPVTFSVIAFEMRQPRYHGVWATRINPCLNRYLDNETF